MMSQTQETPRRPPLADGKTHARPLSSYLGLAIIAAIMLAMIVLQSAGAQDLIQ